MQLTDFELRIENMEAKLYRPRNVSSVSAQTEKLCYRFDLSWAGTPEGTTDVWGIKSEGCLLYSGRDGTIAWNLPKAGSGYRLIEANRPSPALQEAVLRAIRSSTSGRAACEKLDAHWRQRMTIPDPRFDIGPETISVGA